MTDVDIQISQFYFEQLNTAVAERGKMSKCKSQVIFLSPLIDGGVERDFQFITLFCVTLHDVIQKVQLFCNCWGIQIALQSLLSSV